MFALLRYPAACATLAILASCMGGTSAPVPDQAAGAGRHGRSTSGCPCIYVTNPVYASQSITVYPTSATGNVAPIRAISGGMTLLKAPYGIAVDAAGDIYVADYLGTGSTSGAVEVYAPGSNGNVAPFEYISGSATGLSAPAGVAINPLNGNIYVLNDGNYSVTIYSPGSTGNVAPIGTIAGSRTKLTGETFGIAFDASANLYIGNDNNTITVYAAGATGNIRPIRTISGPRTKLTEPINIALDPSSNLYAANPYPHTSHVFGSITAYAAGANRNAKPIQYIKGAMTKLDGPHAVAVDGSGNLVVVNYYGDSITTYAPGATGNVAPINTIKGGRTGLNAPTAMTIR